mmetsp:Transcript_63298/g.137712  ORF Transcript_63298/g.137712 Transcript_63298/m.137712 type:complete len:525 (+) Transcript_63298:86-1660(+)
MPIKLEAYEEGGDKDPRVTFRDLGASLRLVKEELSPWGWRAYTAEFAERRAADQKLQALSKLPGSGVEPSDGMIRGTPLWQERLDKMMLVEHLKRKLMAAHNHFSNAGELLLRSHEWLVKDGLLAEKFVVAITHVPDSQYERVDILQIAIRDLRNELKGAHEAHEDYVTQLKRDRASWVQKTIENQDSRMAASLSDDILVSWSYAVQRIQVLRLRDVCQCQQARVSALQNALAMSTEDRLESERQWDEQREALTKDRDHFKKLYGRMLAAHEKAMADLESVQGTAEGQVKLIQVLTVEKSLLEGKVETLEDDKSRMERQLGEARDLVSQLREEHRRLIGTMRGTEGALSTARLELSRLEELRLDLEAQLDAAVAGGVRLRDDLELLRGELDALRAFDAEGLLEEEKAFRRSIESERDLLLDFARGREADLKRTIEECRQQVEAVRAKAEKELHDFKTTELARVKDDFEKRTAGILRRNEILEREVAQADAVAPHLQVLNPLSVDPSRICAVCKRMVVYEAMVPL